LPRSGPNRSELLNRAAEQDIATHIITVDERATQVRPSERTIAFPASFVEAPALAPDLIRPGDTLSFTIFENVDDGLFSRQAGAASIGALKVDEDGFIFVPYAGRIRAVGNSSERMRQILTERLGEETPRPQVIIQRTAGDGGTVSVVGDGVAGQGVFPLQRSNLRLMGMLASAGGVVGDPQLVRVIIIRGAQRVEMLYKDIYENPRYDIALRPGDRIIVERNSSSFIALGATGVQGIVPFEQKSLSALEAIAQVGGLSNTTADPTGVFVIRDENPEIANTLLGRNDFTTEQRLIYVINLTEPNGFFLARNFEIQDGDTLYVTEAPFTQWTKTLNAIIGTSTSVRSLEAITTVN
jgi:polysaccharide export outer membrane protein